MSSDGNFPSSELVELRVAGTGRTSVSGVAGVIVRGGRSLSCPWTTRPVCFDYGRGRSIDFVCWFEYMLHCCQMEPYFSFCCFPAEFSVGRFFFLSSQSFPGDGVLAETSEFHEPKHFTTLAINKFLGQVQGILITMMIGHFLCLYLWHWQKLGGQSTPTSGYVTIAVRRVECPSHKPACCWTTDWSPWEMGPNWGSALVSPVGWSGSI